MSVVRARRKQFTMRWTFMNGPEQFAALDSKLAGVGSLLFSHEEWPHVIALLPRSIEIVEEKTS